MTDQHGTTTDQHGTTTDQHGTTTDQHGTTTVGQLPAPTPTDSRVPSVLTRLAWLLWVASLGVVVARFVTDTSWGVTGVVVIDGMTAVMWAAVTFFSGIVHSYSRRYLAGSRHIDRFFKRVFAFTLAVMVLVAADSFLLFLAAWIAMGRVMANLIGHVEGWPQAQAAAGRARRYFLAGGAAVAVALGALWWTTGAAAISAVPAAVPTAPPAAVLVAAVALLLAAVIQSALVPFHTWLLSSMTAPTPASALMHAGFVNAGGVLLIRFAPVVAADAGVMLTAVVVGAASAMLGKLLKTVQTDVKGELGCSTVGQMSFMIVQAGLGYFAAAVTHLILHGFYKAYQFLSAGDDVDHESPTATAESGATTPFGVVVTAGTALAGGVTFAALTGKGTALDTGLLLTLLVTLTTLHAAREVVADSALPPGVRYGAVPVVAIPAIAVYAGVYNAVSGLLAEVPGVGEPVALTPVHGVVAVAFVVAYVAVETRVYTRSRRLYVTLLNATQPAPETQLTTTEEYNEY
ncbi:proton-conducting transporter membrane subunit [Halobellus salinus]|uniref:proton-conducting transporter transmembrane domain-containing protein n=1 Tax=Halobellus salinus TaxID=931585 RepID=UPI0016630385|nr:proton-conducting transporter membrane subunit [Halobellus salinus]